MSRSATGLRRITRWLVLSALLTGLHALPPGPLVCPAASFGAKHEPPGRAILHGAQAEVRPQGFFSTGIDWNGLEAYTRACGHRPILVMHYISLDPVAFRLLMPRIAEIGKQRYDYIPQIGLDFYRYAPRFDILHPTDITAEIADGRHDRKLVRLARFCAGFGGPVFLRPGYEFGGRGQGRHAAHQDWIRAWRRIYLIFQREQAENVAFVWNTLDAPDYSRYYPGDEFVDWWGINIFSDRVDADQFVKTFVNDAESHRKPVMIAESTPRTHGTGSGTDSWKQWFGPIFRLMMQYPNIKAFCYINASWEGYPDRSFSRDTRIQSDTFVKRSYGRMMTRMPFIHAASERMSSE